MEADGGYVKTYLALESPVPRVSLRSGSSRRSAKLQGVLVAVVCASTVGVVLAMLQIAGRALGNF